MKEEEEEAAASGSIISNTYTCAIYVVPFDNVRFHVAASDIRS